MKPEEIERTFADGECILEAGSLVRELYIVRSGEVELGAGAPDARVLSQGDVFGERGALLSEPATAAVTSIGDSSVLVLDPGLVERLCCENAEFAMRLIQELTRRSGALAAQVEREATPPGFTQLCRSLLELRTSKEPPCPIQGQLRDIADHAGITMQDAYQGIQLLLEQRALRLVDDQLSVVDPERLGE